MTQLRALALVRALSPSPARSRSELLAQRVLDALPDGIPRPDRGVVDYDVRPDVELDTGDGTM